MNKPKQIIFALSIAILFIVFFLFPDFRFPVPREYLKEAIGQTLVSIFAFIIILLTPFADKTQRGTSPY